MSLEMPKITWQQVRPEAYRVCVWEKAGDLGKMIWDSGWVPENPAIPAGTLREGREYDIEASVKVEPTENP